MDMSLMPSASRKIIRSFHYGSDCMRHVRIHSVSLAVWAFLPYDIEIAIASELLEAIYLKAGKDAKNTL